ncbi:MAG: hypothetical protein SPI49_01215 [Eubacteriales bacterium]|nr:hypothetical protein [Eubacteriales bacterium]
MTKLNDYDLIYCREFVVYRNYDRLPFNADSNENTASSVYNEVKECVDSDFIEIDLNSESDKDVLYTYNSTFFTEELLSKYPYIKIFIKGNLLLLLNTDEHIELRYIEYDNNISADKIIITLENVIKIFSKYSSFALENGKYINSLKVHCGTGIFINSYIHLPILQMFNKIKDNDLLDNVFSISKEQNIDSNPICAMIKFSNVNSLYSQIDEQIAQYNSCIKGIIDDEMDEHNKIFLSSQDVIKDKILKAFGIVRYSMFLDDYEYISIFTFFRAASEFGIISLDVNQLDKIFRFIHTKTYFIENFEEACKKKSELLRKILLPAISKNLED